jgi:hypothetical protein
VEKVSTAFASLFYKINWKSFITIMKKGAKRENCIFQCVAIRRETNFSITLLWCTVKVVHASLARDAMNRKRNLKTGTNDR